MFTTSYKDEERIEIVNKANNIFWVTIDFFALMSIIDKGRQARFIARWNKIEKMTNTLPYFVKHAILCFWN